MIIDPAKTQKELTYQVVLDALALTTCYPAFLITADVPEIYMQQFWFTINKKDSTTYRLSNQDFDELPSDEEIVSFIKELGHKGDIKSITEVVVDHMYQPWRTFAAIINKCLSGKITDFTFQIESRDHKKQEKMYYPRFTKANIHHFITKDKSISIRNRMFMHTTQDDSILGTMRFVSKSDDFQVYGALLPSRMTNRQMQESDAYKNYLTYATCEASPKMKRKYKKPASPSKKRTLVTVEEEEHKPAKKVVPFKKPVPKRQFAGVRIQNTPGVSVSKKKAPAKAERNCGSSGGADFESEVPDEPKGKSSDTSKGTGLKPRVLDVSKSDSSESEYEFWGDNGDENANDQQKETQDDEFVHTPEDYVPTDDETNDESNDVTEEEYERINEELYGDVNVSLTDAEPADKEKDDEEMTVASHDNVYQEGAGNQVKDDAHATQKTEVVSMLDMNVQHEAPCTSPLLTIPVFVIPEPNVINPSKTVTTTPEPTISSLSTTSTTVVPDSETLTAIHQRVSDLENEVKILKEVDHKSDILAAIKFEVPPIVKEYLGTSLDDSINKTALDEFDMKKALFDSMHASKSFNKTPTNKTLYHALMESLIEDENAMDQGALPTLSQNLLANLGNTDDQPNVEATSKHDWFKKPERPPTPDSDWNVGKSKRRLATIQKLSTLERDVIFDLGVALRMFTRRIVILKRVKDLQLEVESYQKKLNITKPETFRLPILNPGEYDLWLMRIEQYFLMTDCSFWEVILNGNKVLKRTTGETEQEYEPTTVEEKQDRRNEMKARGTLLMVLPIKDQLKFHSKKDAKLLMEAIEKRYGVNKESKKVQRTLFKQQYETFSGSSSEKIDQTFDRLQKLISQLEIQGEVITQEDMNLKLLRSLPFE
ncbi:hypothetical protein Tco_0792959 [Tanacetum coccineum]